MPETYDVASTSATRWRSISIHVLPKIVADLTLDYGADCPVAYVVFRATWPDSAGGGATL